MVVTGLQSAFTLSGGCLQLQCLVFNLPAIGTTYLTGLMDVVDTAATIVKYTLAIRLSCHET